MSSLRCHVFFANVQASTRSTASWSTSLDFAIKSLIACQVPVGRWPTLSE